MPASKSDPLPEDFGFTFAKDIPDAHERLIKMRSLIMPLLVNLSQNADKDTIKWPGMQRAAMCNKIAQEINELVDGHQKK